MFIRMIFDNISDERENVEDILDIRISEITEEEVKVQTDNVR